MITAFILGMATMYLLCGVLMARRLRRALQVNLEAVDYAALIMAALLWGRGILWERRR